MMCITSVVSMSYNNRARQYDAEYANSYRIPTLIVSNNNHHSSSDFSSSITSNKLVADIK
jgi:hypothetical protein